MATALVDLAPLVRPTRGQAYFNPRPADLTLEYGGCRYVFKQGFGELAVNYSTRNSAVYRDTGEAHTPENLFRHFFGDDGRSGKAGECGIRPLFGDHRDESIVGEAEQAFRETQYQADMRIKLAHMARVENERKTGVAVTAPGPEIEAAMNRIAERDRARGWSSAFACPYCAKPVSQIPAVADKSSELEAALAAQNKLIADQAAMLAQLQAVVAESLSRKKPGPKPKVKPETSE